MVKHLEDRVARLAQLVKGWTKSNIISHIERDLALDELRKLYDELLAIECGVPYKPAPLETKRSEPKRSAEPRPAVESEPVAHKVDPIADFDDALDIDALLGITDDEPASAVEPVAVVAVEPVAAPVAEPEPVVEPTSAPGPEPVPTPNRGGGLFAIEDIPVRSKSSRKMINLYNSPAAQPTPGRVEATPAPSYAPQPQNHYVPQPQPVPQPEYVSQPASQPHYVPQPQPQYVPQPQPVSQSQYVPQPQVEYIPQPHYAPQPQPVPQPVPQPLAQPMQQTAPQPLAYQESVAPQRVGDVLGSGRRVVGDVQTHDNAPIAPMNKISDLRKAIGLNDKFLLLRDLFNGDVPLYERTIDTLNAFEDLDECLIYIVENFRWNPDSEGAKMLVSLIERKLS
ncbi:MAG: hypothetical protein IKV29_02490 [Alistipes sp.]|nr:hypothetical protein [Alistipes sp.]